VSEKRNEIGEAMARAPAGLCISTVLKILWGTVEAVAGGDSKDDPACIPAIMYQSGKHRWDVLVSWDNTPMAHDAAVAFAQGAIDKVRGTPALAAVT
jgi:hypothetical protein